MVINMQRYCPQTLDKPVLLFGLEAEDIAIIAGIGGGGALFIGPQIPGMIAIGLWIFLMNFKKDKPTAYMFHWLYSQGLDMPGLIPPLRRVNRYGVYAKSTNNKKLSFHRAMV